jgi:hypothetical protein
MSRDLLTWYLLALLLALVDDFVVLAVVMLLTCHLCGVCRALQLLPLGLALLGLIIILTPRITHGGACIFVGIPRAWYFHAWVHTGSGTSVPLALVGFAWLGVEEVVTRRGGTESGAVVLIGVPVALPLTCHRGVDFLTDFIGK